jgi:L-2-hydroxycarboxylate dehydrogenase (NAD+)
MQSVHKEMPAPSRGLQNGHSEQEGMNKPPAEYTSLPAEALRRFVAEVFSRAGMPSEQAVFLADLLVTNDLRGVFSHGTQQVPNYVGHFREGRLTPTPEITTVSESPTTLVLDGGGGLGYFPCHQAATRLIAKAQGCGVAIASTRNHGHFGAAGIYARIPLAHDLICYVTSGHQLNLKPGDFVMAAAGGSPMAFGIPCGDEPPFVLDFGAVHDMYIGPEEMQKIMELVPSTVLRSFGLGCACQALGGLLCGVPVDPERAKRRWPGANQGSFMIAVDIKALFPLDQFKQEMDAYARKVRQLMPLPGLDEARLPGAIEWERARHFTEEGIPIGPRHAAALRKLAADHDLASPV